MKYIKYIIFIVGTLFLAGAVFFWDNTQKPSSFEKTAGLTDTIKNKQSVKEDILCFGKKTFQQYIPDDPGGNAYLILVLDISNPDSVEGYTKYYPYGTDSNVGSILGTYDVEQKIIRAQISAYGEGMSYTNSHIWKFNDDGKLISGYTESQLDGSIEEYENLDEVIWNTEYPEQTVSCDQISQWEEELQNTWGVYSSEPDRERLALVLEDTELAKTIQVTERHIDIDSNWQTEETLYYLQDENYCEGELCTLIIVNKENEIMLKYMVGNKHVYLSNYEQQGEWKDIVVWNNGSYRLLKYNIDSGYPMNESLGQKISLRDVEWYPERYFPVI